MKNKDIYKEDKSFIKDMESLDKKAGEIGIGGKHSPEIDEGLYKKRMKARKTIQKER